MAELTREYLDKQLSKLPTKQDIKSIKDLVKNEVGRLDEKIDSLAHSVDEKIDGLARMVADGFEEIKEELDVKREVENLGRRMSRIEQALNIKN